jgi:hypothetical protein
MMIELERLRKETKRSHPVNEKISDETFEATLDSHRLQAQRNRAEEQQELLKQQLSEAQTEIDVLYEVCEVSEA